VAFVPKELRLLVGCLVLSSAGCSGSSDVIEGPGGPLTAEELTTALRQTVLPAVASLGSFSPVNQPAAAPVHDGRSEVGDCHPFDLFCFSGGFEVCQAGDEGPVTFRYRMCDRPVGRLDGTWSLERTGLEASAEFDLAVNVLVLSGRIAYVLDDMCWKKKFLAFTAAGPDYGATMDGVVDYCFATGIRSGRLEIAVDGPRGPFDLTLEFDEESGSILALREAATTACSLSMREGTLECHDD
jgi:hypothetical protein